MLMSEKYTLSEFDICLYHNHNGYMTDRSVIGSAYNYFAAVLDGRAEFTSADDGTSFSLVPGELLFIPEGSRYLSRWYGENGCTFYSLLFLFRNPFENRKYILQKQTIPDLDTEKILDKIYRSQDEVLSLGDFYQLYGIARQYLREAPHKKIHDPILSAMKTLEEPDCCGIPELAKRCCMSEASFYKLFKEEMGCTPIEYRNTARCRRASDLLTATEMSVEQVAEAVGCANSAYLRRMLRKHLGKTPRMIRKNIHDI